MIVKTKAFKDEHGNCFVFPNLIVIPDHPKSPSESDVIIQAMAVFIALGTRIEYYSEGWFEFDLETFRHVRGEIGHPSFFNGHAVVYLFEGPTFDEIMKGDEQTLIENSDAFGIAA